MSKYARRQDINHQSCAEEAKELGFSVFSTHMVGHGFPDLVLALGGYNFLWEIKRDGRAKPTTDELLFAKAWRGHYIVASTTYEFLVSAIVAVRKLRGESPGLIDELSHMIDVVEGKVPDDPGATSTPVVSQAGGLESVHEHSDLGGASLLREVHAWAGPGTTTPGAGLDGEVLQEDGRASD